MLSRYDQWATQGPPEWDPEPQPRCNHCGAFVPAAALHRVSVEEGFFCDGVVVDDPDWGARTGCTGYADRCPGTEHFVVAVEMTVEWRRCKHCGALSREVYL